MRSSILAIFALATALSLNSFTSEAIAAKSKPTCITNWVNGACGLQAKAQKPPAKRCVNSKSWFCRKS